MLFTVGHYCLLGIVFTLLFMANYFFQRAQQRKAEAEAKGLMTSNYGKLPPRRVNDLMRKYPQPK